MTTTPSLAATVATDRRQTLRLFAATGTPTAAVDCLLCNSDRCQSCRALIDRVLLKKNCSSPFVNFPSHCNRQLVRELGSTFSALARVSQLLSFAPSSTAAFLALLLCFALVCAFEFANGFHDTANAVATVIYTNALKARVAVVWSALMNFLGVLLGGIAVAYALVELLPPDVLSPQNGSPAVPMLVALFTTALAWNLFTWWFAIPNSSSHCVVGSLIGIAVGDALIDARHIREAVDWGQVWSVLRALAISPILGFAGAGLLILRFVISQRIDISTSRLRASGPLPSGSGVYSF